MHSRAGVKVQQPSFGEFSCLYYFLLINEHNIIQLFLIGVHSLRIGRSKLCPSRVSRDYACRDSLKGEWIYLQGTYHQFSRRSCLMEENGSDLDELVILLEKLPTPCSATRRCQYFHATSLKISRYGVFVNWYTIGNQIMSRLTK